MDNTDGIAKLASLLSERHCTTQIAYGEWQATRHEFAPRLPHVGVLQARPSPLLACPHGCRAALPAV